LKETIYHSSYFFQKQKCLYETTVKQNVRAN